MMQKRDVDGHEILHAIENIEADVRSVKIEEKPRKFQGLWRTKMLLENRLKPEGFKTFLVPDNQNRKTSPGKKREETRTGVR